MTGWDSRGYAVFRFLLGAYLFVHFASLVPFAAELFSNQGVMSAASSPLIGVFPNVLGWLDAPSFATGLVLLGAILGLAVAAGFRDRFAAVLLWFIWACLLGRNPLIANPSIPFVGWLLLFHAAVPARPDAGWRLDRRYTDVAWLVMAAAYTFSGLSKLGSISWLDGTALYHVLSSPLARPTIVRELLLGSPVVLMAMSYAVLALEVLAAPLALSRRLRPWLWLALVGMHLGILVTVDFADLTVGMLLMHVITFDPNWLHPPLWRGGAGVAAAV